jgi:hypothetical protein
VATAERVWVGDYSSLVRVDLGPSPSVTKLDLGYPFEPMAADATTVWGARINADHLANDTRLRRLSVDGTVLVDLGYDPTGFALTNNEAWLTAAPGVIAILDPATGKLVASGDAQTVMNQGPAQVHVLDGVAWAIDTYTNQLARITRR